MNERIMEMAQEAGLLIYSDELARFAQLVAEDCARECAAMLERCHDRSEYNAYNPDDAQTIGWVDALNESQKRIRARYNR